MILKDMEYEFCGRLYAVILSSSSGLQLIVVNFLSIKRKDLNSLPLIFFKQQKNDSKEYRPSSCHGFSELKYSINYLELLIILNLLCNIKVVEIGINIIFLN